MKVVSVLLSSSLLLASVAFAGDGAIVLHKKPERVAAMLQEMSKMLDDTDTAVVSARAQLLVQHNFPAGTPLKDLFSKNNLYVQFDFPEIGQKRLTSSVFFATLHDLIDYFEKILKYKVVMQGRGIFLVNECWEELYTVPIEAQEYLTAEYLVSIMDHKNASVRYLPKLGQIFFYDDWKGHKRMHEIVDYVTQLIAQKQQKERGLSLKGDESSFKKKKHWWSIGGNDEYDE